VRAIDQHELAPSPDLGALSERALFEMIARSRPAEAGDLPADVARARIEIHARSRDHIRASEGERLLREPLEARSRAHVKRLLELRACAARSIELRRRRRGEERSGTLEHVGADRELVAPGDAARWVKHVDVARSVGFRVKRALNEQRAPVPPALDHRRALPPGERKLELCRPRRGLRGRERRDRHDRFLYAGIRGTATTDPRHLPAGRCRSKPSGYATAHAASQGVVPRALGCVTARRSRPVLRS
jgi:hypothetical protein